VDIGAAFIKAGLFYANAYVQVRAGGKCRGGIGLQRAMPGSVDDVKREAETRILALAPGGGYFLAPANHIQNDALPESVITLYEYVREFGTYPIR